MPIEDGGDGMVVLGSCAAPGSSDIYPKGKIMGLCNREFTATLDQLFGATPGAMDRQSIGDLLSDMQDDGGDEAEDMKSAAADNEVVKLVQQGYRRRLSSKALRTFTSSPIRQGQDRVAFARTACCSPTSRCPIAIAMRSPRASRSCATSTSPSDANPYGKIKFKKFGPLENIGVARRHRAVAGWHGRHRDAHPRRRRRAHSARQARPVQGQPRRRAS